MVVLVSFVSLEEEGFYDVLVQWSTLDLYVKHSLNDTWCKFMSSFRIQTFYLSFLCRDSQADKKLHCIE